MMARLGVWLLCLLAICCTTAQALEEDLLGVPSAAARSLSQDDSSNTASVASTAAAGGAQTGSGASQCVYSVSSLVGGGDGNTTANLTLSQDAWPQYGTGFSALSLYVVPETPNRLHIKVQPSDGPPRFQYPESLLPRPVPESFSGSPAYTIKHPSEGSPFAINITRRANGQPIFDTSGTSFCFKDQYIELTTAVPKDADLYGIGEASLPTGMLLPRNGTILTLWARDIGSNTPWANLYGAHPFFLQVNADGSSHGALTLVLPVSEAARCTE